jgi:hypothetical protein
MRSSWALSLIVVLGCGWSDLADELLIEEPLDASTDFDVDTTPPEDASRDSGHKPVKDASPPVKDAIAPPPEKDALPPDVDAMPEDDSGPPPRECSPDTCPTGCCYGKICALGKQNIACGTNGFACTDCTAFGEQCFSGVCGSLIR